MIHLKRLGILFSIAASLGGCAAPTASQYYTLMGPAVTVAKGPPSSSYAISVQPVVLPEQVDRPQLVLSGQTHGEVLILNESLWASPLSDEIRAVLSEELTKKLGVLDIALAGAPQKLPIWIINLTVQRFDSIYAEAVVLDVTWRLSHRQNDPKICRALVTVPVEPGVPAVIAGHRHALSRVASAIADQLSGAEAMVSDAEFSTKGCTKV